MEENKMEGENNNNKGEEEMLPGFRFHPTDEELVGFYLKRKIQQQPLSIELIKQLDIYKFDPWDLPKFATGEKEWYFYCPRDRKYRNSARPNRVTGAGFWKATGTDRPIYSAQGNKCIGLKKSLVFYKGRAAKGVKTDWMMHEFRLPSLAHSLPSKKCLDTTLPANDAWAICRIFKKTSPITPRTLSNSYISPSLLKSNPCTPIIHGHNTSKANTPHLSPQSILDTATSSPMQSNSGNMYEMNNILQSPNNFSLLDIPSCNKFMDNQFLSIPTMLDLPPSYILPQLEPSEQPKSQIDIPSMLMNMSSIHGSFSTNNRECNADYHDLQPDLATLLSQDYIQHANVGNNHEFDENNEVNYEDIHNALMGNLSSTLLPLHNEEEQHQCGDISNVGSFPVLGLPEPWKSSASLIWDCSPLS